MDAVRPILLVSAHAEHAIELRVLSALLPWAQDWLPGDAEDLKLDVSGTVRPSDLEGRFEAQMTAAGRLWIRTDVPDRRALLAALVGADGTSLTQDTSADALSQALIGAALQARNESLGNVLLGTADGSAPWVDHAPVAALTQFGSGAVCISCEAIGLKAIADGSVLRHVPPMERPAQAAAAGPKPVEQTLHARRVEVHAVLGHTELNLDDFLGLDAGDVLRLPTRLEDALELRSHCHLLARAHLGTQAGHRAVQLIKH
jgi:flagellar motor switch/type III secretory pathway protein FliN